MASWLNHVTIAAPRNATTTHTVDPSTGTVVAGSLFTPTAGRLLVVGVSGAVTSTTPSGWTLPTNGSAIGGSGGYVWTRTAAGADTFTTTHNGSNYPVVFDFYEFPAGSTFVACASLPGVASNGGSFPTLSGLTGTNWIAGVASQNDNTTATGNSFTWDMGVEAVDTFTPQGGGPGTDGYGYSLTYLEDSVLTSASPSAASTLTTATIEKLTFAVNVATVAAPAFDRAAFDYAFFDTLPPVHTQSVYAYYQAAAQRSNTY